MKKSTLIASAGTLEDIRESITRFYGGEAKILRAYGEKTWAVSNGREVLTSVRVVLKRGRYRFEMVE